MLVIAFRLLLLEMIPGDLRKLQIAPWDNQKHQKCTYFTTNYIYLHVGSTPFAQESRRHCGGEDSSI